jgi:hypothetical protein
MLSIARLVSLTGALLAFAMTASAVEAPSKGYIYGAADPGSQIVVINLDSGSIVGIVAKADGTYRTDALAAGRYRIAEKGAYHAPRELSVVAGQSSNVDLVPASSLQHP